MAAEHKGGDVLDRHVEFLGQEQAEAELSRSRPCRQHCSAGRPDFSFITHTITSSGLVMAITNASGQWVFDPLRHLGDHAGVLADQVVADHARRAREAGGDDHHVGALDRRVVGTAGHQRIETVDRARLHDVERLAGRDAAEHVEQHDVAEFLQTDKMGKRTANVAGADQGDLVAGHLGCP